MLTESKELPERQSRALFENMQAEFETSERKAAKAQLESAVSRAAFEAYPHLGEQTADVRGATRPEFGHYQTSIAMRLAKTTGLPAGQIAGEILKRPLHLATAF